MKLTAVYQSIINRIAYAGVVNQIRSYMVGFLAVSTAVLLALFFYRDGAISSNAALKSSNSSAVTPEVVATVDGQNITYADIKSFVDAGVDRAIAVDRTVNKVLVANAAKKLYPSEASDVIHTAERDLLSALFLRLKREQVQAMISDASIQNYYDKNITQQQFDMYKLRYYLTRDQSDADNIREMLLKGDKDALGRLEYFNKEAPFISLAALPYNLGRIVKENYTQESKNGVVIGPITVRDGFILVMVDAYKPGNRPELSSALKATIREQMIENALSVALTELRSNAKILIK